MRSQIPDIRQAAPVSSKDFLQDENAIAGRQGGLYVQLASRDVAMFRFLLEGYDNLAYFTVLQKNPAILKICHARASQDEVLAALAAIGRTVKISVIHGLGTCRPPLL